MPDYRAQVSLADDLELDFCDRKGEWIGTIKIKQSTIQWKPRNKSKWRSVSLEAFSKWMEENGDLVTR